MYSESLFALIENKQNSFCLKNVGMEINYVQKKKKKGGGGRGGGIDSSC